MEGNLQTIKENVVEAVSRIEKLQEPQLLSELEHLQTRLDDPRKWVAVFGAFSAGKSSLINALLKDHPLTVSPHPTTAAITEVQAPALKGVQEVHVTAKTREQMEEDVMLALSHLHLSAKGLDDAIRVAVGLKAADFPTSARRHVGFLKAVAAGYESMSARLGTSWACTEAELKDLTANESIACYVQRVNLEHAADILQNGMVLVDTPGVDSIHRRHTDVAFEFMRRADAIIFVLYYSHAFSRADQAFLSQLAAVQDIAGVNKLFVAINAVDLAANEEEKQAVINRVTTELRGVGIAKPRIFPVSSQIAFASSKILAGAGDNNLVRLLEQRLGLPEGESLPDVKQIWEESGMRSLENDLVAFLGSESQRIAQSAVENQYRAVQANLSNRIERFRRQQQEDKEQFEARLSRTEELRHSLSELEQDVRSGQSSDEQSLLADWQELVFHAGERIRLSFGANFRSAFHPGLFRAKGNPRPLLQEASTELAEMLSRQIEAEVRTFGLRAEAQVEAALLRFSQRIQNACNEAETDVLLDTTSPHLPATVRDLPHRAALDWKLLQPFFRHFSSSQQFFEGGGQREMLQAAEGDVTGAARRTLTALTDIVTKEWIDTYRSLVSELLQETTRMLDAQTNVSGVDESTVVQYEQILQWFQEQLQ